MAIAIQFSPASMDAARYDEILRRLDAAGEGAPAGRIFHVCHGTGDRLRVLDVWDSRESFERFGATLLPVLRELGIDPGQPEITGVHNTLAGDAASGAVAVAFTPHVITAAAYDETMRLLGEAGERATAGLVFHTCHGTGDELRVFDVWSSRESFERFGPILAPLLAAAGIDAGEPEVV
ncbi:MAG TPA: hypothetical protein VF541_16990, partial [Longimicrobium sp.]